jgi:hypothetical protein
LVLVNSVCKISVAYQFTASPLLARKTLHRCRDITYVNLNFAKVDVASSSLVVASAKADRPKPTSYGWQASPVMHYVYLLKSKSSPRKQYVGSTRDLRQRFKAHNESRFSTYSEVSALDSPGLFCFCGQKDRGRI